MSLTEWQTLVSSSATGGQAFRRRSLLTVCYGEEQTINEFLAGKKCVAVLTGWEGPHCYIFLVPATIRYALFRPFRWILGILRTWIRKAKTMRGMKPDTPA